MLKEVPLYMSKQTTINTPIKKVRARLVKNGYQICLRDLSRSDLERLKRELTVKPELPVEYAKPKSFKIFMMDSVGVEVPRHWGRTNFGEQEYAGRMGKAVDFVLREGFALDARRRQPEAAEVVLNELRSKIYAGGLICLPCGGGKTVTLLYILAMMKLKSAICVHKTCLMNQWEERIKEFIPAARLGYVQGTRIQTENCDIILCMVQSVSMKALPDHIFDDVGFVAFDECHLVNTYVFSKVLRKLHTRYMIGLTATPHRKDKLEKVIEWHVGPILFQVEREDMTASVELVYSDVSDCRELLNRANKPDQIGMITAMVEDFQRNTFISNIIAAECVEGAKILVISERRAHLDHLSNLLVERGLDPGQYVGGMSREDLKVSEEKVIILGTYSMASTGLDIKDLTTLVLATPRSDVIQTCGRVVRNKTKKEKKIIDIVDRYSCFIGQMRRRVATYHKLNYSVTTNKCPVVMEEESEDEGLGEGCLIDDGE